MQRLGFLRNIHGAEDTPLRIWLHAASVGEVQVARALVAEIKRQLPEAALTVSTVTEQGHKVAQSQLGRHVQCIFAPLDLEGIVNRSLQTVRPHIYICLETELWPAVLRQADKHGVRLILLNARLSEGSFRYYKKISGFWQAVLNRFDAIAAIRPNDAERYIALGASPEKVKVYGNAKYDLIAELATPDIKQNYRELFDLLDDETVLVAGSTHTGEEEMLLEVFRSLAATTKNLVWVIAPRHLTRIAEVESLLMANNLEFDRLSTVKNEGRKHNVVLVDTMGDLAGLYSIATYVFCGGSLVPRGGHNILEAAVWGKPVFYGPSMTDFIDAKNLLESSRAAFPITQARGMTEIIRHLEKHPMEYADTCERARQTTLAHLGSAKKQVQLVKEIINT